MRPSIGQRISLRTRVVLMRTMIILVMMRMSMRVWAVVVVVMAMIL